MTVISIEQDSVTGPERVGQGQAINPRDVTVYGMYKDGNRKTVGVRTVDLDTSTPGTKTARIKVAGFDASFTTEVVPLSSITLVSPPSKVTYNRGESLNLAGLKVTGAWAGLPAADIAIAASDITGFNANTLGQQRLTITKFGKTAVFNVNVIVDPLTEPKTIVITVGSDIAFPDNNRNIVAALFTPETPGESVTYPFNDELNKTMVASNLGGEVVVNAQSRTITIPLIDGKTLRPWTGNGTYWFLVVYPGNNRYKQAVTFNSGTTNITITATSKF